MSAITVSASRPGPGESLLAHEAAVAPGLFGDVEPAYVRLVAHGRQTWASLRVEHGRSATGRGAAELIRLGRFLWSDLEIKPGAEVTVERCDELPVATEVHLVPPAHLSVRTAERVRDQLISSAGPARVGGRVVVGLGDRGSGLVLRVQDVTPSGSLIAAETEIHFVKPDARAGSQPASLADVGGLSEVVDQLRDLVELPLLRPDFFRRLGIAPPRGVLLHGPPGTGKSLVCRSLAEDLSIKTLTLAAAELVGGSQGETEANIRHLFSHALSHAPCLILIDEFDVIGTRRDWLASQGDIRATSQLLSLMDGLEGADGLMVVATTNRVEAVDPAFRRPGRFEREIFVGPPSEAGRREILEIHTRDMPLAVGALDDVASRTPGFVGADLMHLARAAGLAAAGRVSGGLRGFEVADALVESEISVEREDFAAALQEIRPSAMRETGEVMDVLAWDDIVGHEDIKESLVAVADAVLHGRLDPDQPHLQRAAALQGPSGVGKSLLARSLAARTGANVLVVDPGTVFTQWLGQSEEAVRQVFERARRLSPCIVVLEHLDVLAPRRTGVGDTHAAERVLAALATALDTLPLHGVLVLGLTDRPDLVDDSIMRSGRLGLHLEVSPPAESDRRRLLTAASTRLGFEPHPRTVDEVVAAGAGLTQAQFLALAENSLGEVVEIGNP